MFDVSVHTPVVFKTKMAYLKATSDTSVSGFHSWFNLLVTEFQKIFHYATSSFFPLLSISDISQ
jgi:hypothetical protein